MSQVYYTADELEAAYAHASRHDMPQAWRRALDRGYDVSMRHFGRLLTASS
jgi:hypothetical protein